MQHDSKLLDRINDLEAKVRALTCVGLPFVGLTIINMGVALWYFQQKSEPDWNFISVTLTIFQMTFAIALVGGFWVLRSAAEAAAAKEAKEVATKVASEEARKSAIDWLDVVKSAQGEKDSSTTDLTDMINSMGAEPNGGKDDD